MKDTNQRLFLAIAIWLAAIFGYYTFFAPKNPVQAPAAQQASQAEPAAAAQPPIAAAAAAPSKAADVPRGTSEPRRALPVREITFETPRARVVLTSEGAAVKSIQLIGEKWTLHKGKQEQSA